MKKSHLYSNRTILCILFTALLLPGKSGAQFSDPALFVVADAALLNAAESKIDSLLNEMGFDLTVTGQVDVTDGSANGMSLVLVSASVTSGTIVTNMPGLPTLAAPVINWEPALHDFLGFSELDVGEFNTTEIEIVGEGHQMAAGNANGNVTIASAAKAVSFGVPAGDADIIAVNTLDSSQAVIFGYDEGAAMFTGLAPARRVGTFLLNDVADSTMTADGWDLFIASLYWAMDYVGVGIEDRQQDKSAISLHDIYPNPSGGLTQINYSVSVQTHVNLSIWNTAGVKIETLVDGMKAPGTYTAVFDAAGYPGGFYFCRMESGSNTIIKPMTLTK